LAAAARTGLLLSASGFAVSVLGGGMEHVVAAVGLRSGWQGNTHRSPACCWPSQPRRASSPEGLIGDALLLTEAPDATVKTTLRVESVLVECVRGAVCGTNHKPSQCVLVRRDWSV
jgi:hypothetical protein